MNEEDAIKCLNFDTIDRCYIHCLPSSSSQATYPPPQPNGAQDISILNSKLQAFFVQALLLILFSPLLLLLAIMVIMCVLMEKASKATHHRRHHQTTNTTQISYSMEEDFHFGCIGFGLSPRDIQMLPSFNYGVNSTQLVCTVCLEGFKEGERCRLLPKCKHVFHVDCVESWLIRAPTCPICRRVVAKPETIVGSTLTGS